MFNGMNGLEILKNWPRFEDGEPVRIGDDFEDLGQVAGIKFGAGGVTIEGTAGNSDLFITSDERVKRPAPKVLDADGVEIRVGDTVWHVHDLDKFTVTNPNNGENLSVTCMGEDGNEYCCYPNGLTHRAPVLAADGKPLREGETVWHVGNGIEFTVIGLPRSGEYQAVKLRLDDGAVTGLDPDQLTHQRPDSWERLWMDMHPADETECVGLDREEFVRRAKALAGRDAE